MVAAQKPTSTNVESEREPRNEPINSLQSWKIHIWKMIVCLINNDRKNQYPHGEKWSQTPISFHIPISTLMNLNVITQRHFHIIQLKGGPKNVSRENMDKK